MEQKIALHVMMWIPLVLSLTVHEWAHAWANFKLGDDTALRAGRLTLNPLAHIDIVGTVILPLLGAPLGWAKPVPFNPAGFRRDVSMMTGTVISKLAGPFSNLVLAVVMTVIMGLLLRFAPDLAGFETGTQVFLSEMIVMNVGLAIFNMLPIPPLDGAALVEALVPYRFRDVWGSFSAIAPLFLAAVVLGVVNTGFLAGPSLAIMGMLQGIMKWVAG